MLCLAVVACMDARMDLFALLGLARGDAHIIRTAGGLVTDDVLRSLSVSQRLLGTQEIVVVMHHDCGLLGASEERFADDLARDGATQSWRLGSFDDLDTTLRAGLTRLRSSPELPAHERTRGFIFDPETGELREVAREASSSSTLLGEERVNRALTVCKTPSGLDDPRAIHVLRALPVRTATAPNPATCLS